MWIYLKEISVYFRNCIICNIMIYVRTVVVSYLIYQIYLTVSDQI